MNELHAFLATVWFILLGLIITLYALLDGFELGTGILSLLARPAPENGIPTGTPGIWSINELWLVLAGGILFGAFPPAFVLIEHKLRLPLALLLLGLVMRRAGVLAGYWTDKPIRQPALAHNLYGWGSLLTAAMQGMLLGTICCQLSAHDSPLPVWLAPATLAVSATVVLVYSLLGICYLRGRDSLLRGGQVLLVLGICVLAVNLYPDIIPGQLALDKAAASNQTLLFMILAISLLLPLILAYNGFQYLLFHKRSGHNDSNTTPPAV